MSPWARRGLTLPGESDALDASPAQRHPVRVVWVGLLDLPCGLSRVGGWWPRPCPGTVGQRLLTPGVRVALKIGGTARATHPRILTRDLPSSGMGLVVESSATRRPRSVGVDGSALMRLGCVSRTSGGYRHVWVGRVPAVGPRRRPFGCGGGSVIVCPTLRPFAGTAATAAGRLKPMTTKRGSGIALPHGSRLGPYAS